MSHRVDELLILEEFRYDSDTIIPLPPKENTFIPANIRTRTGKSTLGSVDASVEIDTRNMTDLAVIRPSSVDVVAYSPADKFRGIFYPDRYMYVSQQLLSNGVYPQFAGDMVDITVTLSIDFLMQFEAVEPYTYLFVEGSKVEPVMTSRQHAPGREGAIVVSKFRFVLVNTLSEIKYVCEKLKMFGTGKTAIHMFLSASASLVSHRVAYEPVFQ